MRTYSYDPKAAEGEVEKTPSDAPAEAAPERGRMKKLSERNRRLAGKAADALNDAFVWADTGEGDYWIGVYTKLRTLAVEGTY